MESTPPSLSHEGTQRVVRILDTFTRYQIAYGVTERTVEVEATYRSTDGVTWKELVTFAGPSGSPAETMIVEDLPNYTATSIEKFVKRQFVEHTKTTGSTLLVTFGGLDEYNTEAAFERAKRIVAADDSINAEIQRLEKIPRLFPATEAKSIVERLREELEHYVAEGHGTTSGFNFGQARFKLHIACEAFKEMMRESDDDDTDTEYRAFFETIVAIDTRTNIAA